MTARWNRSSAAPVHDDGSVVCIPPISVYRGNSKRRTGGEGGTNRPFLSQAYPFQRTGLHKIGPSRANTPLLHSSALSDSELPAPFLSSLQV